MDYKDIPGYEGLYRLYMDGRVWSYRTKRFLIKNVDRNGYFRYTLARNGKVKNQALHRWLYLTFVGEIPKTHQINHKDGVKQNNELDNLELVTCKENINHAWGIGLARRRHGVQMGSSKLTENDIPKIRQLSKQGLSSREIGGMFNVASTTILAIINERTWKEVVDEKK